MKFIRDNKIVIFILLLGILIRVLIFAWVYQHDSFFSNSDSPSYLENARIIVQYGVMGHWNADILMPAIYPMPMFPAMVAFVIWLFGDHQWWLIAIIQNIFSLVSIVLIWQMAKSVFSAQKLYWPFLIAAIEPYAMYHSNWMLTDTLFSFFVALFSFFFILFLVNDKKLNLILSMIFLGLATLTRPVSQYLLVMLILFLFIKYWKNWREIAKNILIMGIVFLVVVGPWVYRNYRQFEVWQITGEVVGWKLYFYNVGNFLADRNNIGWTEEMEILGVRDYIKNPPRSGQEAIHWDKIFRNKAIEVIFSHPFEYARFHLVKMAPFFIQSRWDVLFAEFSGRPSPTSFNMSSSLFKEDFLGIWRKIFSGEINFFYFFGALMWTVASAGMILLLVKIKNFQRTQKIIILFVLFLIFYFNFLSVPIDPARVRLPVEFMMLIFGYAGIFYFFKPLFASAKNYERPC